MTTTVKTEVSGPVGANRGNRPTDIELPQLPGPRGILKTVEVEVAMEVREM